MAYRTNFLIGALAVDPIFIFLAASPLHVTDTVTGHLFLAITFRANLIVLADHNLTSIIHMGTDFKSDPRKHSNLCYYSMH
jgi:hypothetical protein